MALEKARAAKREYVDLLMKNKNVVACGVGYKRSRGAAHAGACRGRLGDQETPPGGPRHG